MGPLDEDPSRGMNPTLMLADSAQVADGKLFVMGGGWTFTGPQPIPFAIAGLIGVPWQLTNQKHSIRFELIDLDGQAVSVDRPEGEQPLVIDGEFEVGRPPGFPLGASIPFPLAINHGPVQLPSGSHFEWRYEINGEAHDDWRLAFSTRPDAQSQAA